MSESGRSRSSNRSSRRGYGNETAGSEDFQSVADEDEAGAGRSRGLGSVSGYSLPDPAQAAGEVLAGMHDEGRDEFESVLSKGVLSTQSPSVIGNDDDGDGAGIVDYASEAGGMSDYQSVFGSEFEGGTPTSRAPSARGAGTGGSGRRGGSGSRGGSRSRGGNASVNQTIAERVLARVGYDGVDTVAERISEVQEVSEKEGDDGGGGGDDADDYGRGGAETHSDEFRHAGQKDITAIRLDFGTDLMRRIPPPREFGIVHAYIAIDRSKSSLYPTYKFYTQAEDSTMDRFVLAARQEPRSLTFKHKRYIFSTDPDNCAVSAAGYWGKLTSNFMGTNFTIFDRGERRGAHVSEDNERRVLGAVVYEPTTTTGSGGYRKMTALLPTLYKEGEDGMPRLERWEELRDMRNMHLLTSKLPSYKKFDGQWHYCYKFGGRVKCPSKKNFQMVLDGDQESVVLLFGKVSKNIWACDFTHPLSAHQAFAIALSSLSSKMCYAF